MIIKIDSKKGREFGFTSDKFSKDSYLWKDGKFIWISFIASINEHKGNLRALFDTIETKGYNIIVPTPMNRMMAICEKREMKLNGLYHYGDYVESMLKEDVIKTLETK